MELPLLKEMHAEYKDKGFEIVPITLSRSSKEWLEDWEKKHDTHYHYLMEEEGDKVSREKFRIKKQGYVCLLDREGKIRYILDKWILDGSTEIYETLVKKMISE